MPTLHTLLTGISTYLRLPRISATTDINLMLSLLAESPYPQKQQVLQNERATKQNILSAFEAMLQQASGEDVCLFYFSGLGSNLECPPSELGRLAQQEGSFETLMAYDSRSGGGDIVDKELEHLIGKKMARNEFRGNGHILVVLDCGHTAAHSQDEMNMESFYDYQKGAEYPLRGNHVLLAAGGKDQLVKDGVFTQILVGDVRNKGGQRSYREVISSITGDMTARQTAAPKPECYAYPNQYGDLPFLGGAIG